MVRASSIARASLKVSLDNADTVIEGGPFKPSFGLSGAVPARQILPRGWPIQAVLWLEWDSSGKTDSSSSFYAFAHPFALHAAAQIQPTHEKCPTKAKRRLEWATREL
jgi:hypothetical protein